MVLIVLKSMLTTGDFQTHPSHFSTTVPAGEHFLPVSFSVRFLVCGVSNNGNHMRKNKVHSSKSQSPEEIGRTVLNSSRDPAGRKLGKKEVAGWPVACLDKPNTS